jgi:hypothetical protein
VSKHNSQLLLWSAAASTVINGLMFSPAFLGGPHTVYGRLIDAIAAPTGIVAYRFFAPKEHSASAFLAAAFLSLVFSFVFYGVVCWVFVQAVVRFRSWRSSDGCPKSRS